MQRAGEERSRQRAHVIYGENVEIQVAAWPGQPRGHLCTQHGMGTIL